MEMIQSNQTGTAIQLNLFESIKDLLLVKPIFLIGVFLIGFFLFWIFNKDKTLPKLKITVLSLVMYYYLCLMLVNIVGIPTLDEYKRLLQLGETFFNPNVNLIPRILSACRTKCFFRRTIACNTHPKRNSLC